ncbi:hypothetical protein [Vibrio ezurae]|nr:hypothetical protein [Vibrio ezurae]
MKIVLIMICMGFIAGCAQSTGDNLSQQERQNLVKYTHSDMQGRKR